MSSSSSSSSSSLSSISSIGSQPFFSRLSNVWLRVSETEDFVTAIGPSILDYLQHNIDTNLYHCHEMSLKRSDDDPNVFLVLYNPIDGGGQWGEMELTMYGFLIRGEPLQNIFVNFSLDNHLEEEENNEYIVDYDIDDDEQ